MGNVVVILLMSMFVNCQIEGKVEFADVSGQLCIGMDMRGKEGRGQRSG